MLIATSQPINTNLPTIAQAVEQQLLTYQSPLMSKPIVGDVSNIYWVFPGDTPDQVPGRTGQRDVLLIFIPDVSVNVQGDGIFAMLASGMEINIRTTLASDRSGTRKDFLIAHAAFKDGLMDAMSDFFPTDTSGNALTCEGFVIDTNTATDPTRNTLTWGYTISKYRFHYRPNVSPTPIR